MIILDTSVLIWLISSPEKLSHKASQVVEREIKKEEIIVSSISVWEIYLLVKKGRLKFTVHPDKWLEETENLPFIRFVAVDNKIAAYSVNLPDPLHKDPADRIIIATALQIGARVVTPDKKILNYPHIQTVW